jgi:hypothetical protein
LDDFLARLEVGGLFGSALISFLELFLGLLEACLCFEADF